MTARLTFWGFCWWLCMASTSLLAGYGFDGGISLADYAQVLKDAGRTGRSGEWFRVRGIEGVAGEGYRVGDGVAAERARLQQLRAQGIKVCVILRGIARGPLVPTRPGGGYRLPLDLRAVHAQSRWLAQTYGDLVGAWEIDNEPDINFVADNAETYMAYLKACYLGFHQGTPPGVKLGPVLMAPLAQPPGPYLQRLWTNDLADYTDGFNYHYYGYAEDLTGVHHSFRRAVADLQKVDIFSQQRPPPRHGTKSRPPLYSRQDVQRWPVFITEYGYGLLSEAASNSAAGRGRQKNWYTQVAAQLHRLRPAGPMAFVLAPYHEQGLNEFGLLTRPPQTETAAHKTAAAAAPPSLRAHVWEISPALTQLWDFAEQHPYAPLDWSIRRQPASPVVIDFIADENLQQYKDYHGYIARPVSPSLEAPKTQGTGRLILYNFSDQPQTGRLVIKETDQPRRDLGLYKLDPSARVEIPISFPISADRFRGQEQQAQFIPTKGPTAHWSTLLYPDPSAMTVSARRDLIAENQPTATRSSQLQELPRAEEEPPLQQAGRWLVSDGLSVLESPAATTWTFRINHFPSEPLRPAIAELPINKRFTPEDILRGQFRRLDEGVAKGAGLDPLDPQRTSRSGVNDDEVHVLIRTAQGNLFSVFPWLKVQPTWSPFLQQSSNFTPAFFGRALPPWRWADQRPVALVLHFRPARLPATYEAREVEIMRWIAAPLRSTKPFKTPTPTTPPPKP